MCHGVGKQRNEEECFVFLTPKPSSRLVHFFPRQYVAERRKAFPSFRNLKKPHFFSSRNTRHAEAEHCFRKFCENARVRSVYEQLLRNPIGSAEHRRMWVSSFRNAFVASGINEMQFVSPSKKHSSRARSLCIPNETPAPGYFWPYPKKAEAKVSFVRDQNVDPYRLG